MYKIFNSLPGDLECMFLVA